MPTNKTLMDKVNQGRQFRTMTMEIVKRSEDDKDKNKCTVRGYATTFNEPYTLYDGGDWEYREQVAPEAFEECDMSDVIFQYDHEGRVFARVSNGTLHIEKDEHGLLITADLGGTEEGRKLYEEIKGGYTTKMSFGFTVAEDTELRSNEENKEVWLRTIVKIKKLYDVSAVSLPANDGTEISARSLVEGVIAKRSQEIENQKTKEAEEQKAKEEQEAKDKEMRERERLRALALLNI